MAEIKSERSHDQHLLVPEVESASTRRSLAGNRARLASLDIFRGLTVAVRISFFSLYLSTCANFQLIKLLTEQLMILVDDAGGDWPMIAHAPWNGCNLADFVMPFFLFIVGVSIALSLKVNYKLESSHNSTTASMLLHKNWITHLFCFQRISNKCEACKKVCFRTCKLLFWGLLLQGNLTLAC